MLETLDRHSEQMHDPLWWANYIRLTYDFPRQIYHFHWLLAGFQIAHSYQVEHGNIIAQISLTILLKHNVLMGSNECDTCFFSSRLFFTPLLPSIYFDGVCLVCGKACNRKYLTTYSYASLELCSFYFITHTFKYMYLLCTYTLSLLCIMCVCVCVGEFARQAQTKSIIPLHTIAKQHDTNDIQSSLPSNSYHEIEQIL